MYQALQAFFMTGTGNSYKVACWCAQAAADQGVPGELAQIRSGMASRPVSPGALAVFAFPTHGFTAPLLILRYIWRLPRGEKAHAVVIPTRAGIRVKGVVLPGMEGTAGYLAALLLWFKGYSVRGVWGVDMPSNWTALHWGLSAENAAVIAALAEPRVKAALGVVLAGRRHYDGLVQLILGLLLVKISLLYLILGQLILAKLFFAADTCAGCGLCRTICPKHAVSIAGRPPRPYWTYACDSCMACINFCPHKAIQVSPAIILLFYYLTTVPVFAWAARHAAVRFGLDLAAVPLLGFGVRYAYVLIAVAAAYWLLHLSFASRLLRALLARLSHTRYFRRYTAPGVTLADIHKK